MKNLTSLLLSFILLACFAGCSTPSVKQSDLPDQTRFKQAQAGYPDMLDSQREARAKENNLKGKTP